MKRIIILSLFLLLLLLSLTSCKTNYDTHDKATSAAKTELSDNVVSENEVYSFEEINSLFGPGPFSVNELSDTFGEPDFIGGYENSKGFLVLSANFENISFDLVANNGEKLNFKIRDNSKSSNSFDKYEVTNSDKDIQMKPQIVSIDGGNWELPRNIKLGDSKEAVYKAYNGNKGKERVTQGINMLSYDYDETGRITYVFDSNDNTQLIQVTIEWYDAVNWENNTVPIEAPML